MFGGNVLRLSLSDRARALHASIDMYELNFCPSGMSGYALSMEHGVGLSTCSVHIFDIFIILLVSCTQAALRVTLAVTWLTVYRQLQICSERNDS